MMGRAHSLSGAAVWLAGTAVYSITTKEPVDPAVLIMGTAVFSGAALYPDTDSYSATVTKSFGIFGRVLYYVTNAISLLFYNLTRSRKDDARENGHRTFMHTTVAAVLLGAIVYLVTGLPGTTHFFGTEIKTSELSAIIVMAIFLHLGLAGLFSTQIKKAKKAFGPYLLMAASLITTFFFAKFILIPSGVENYHWLAFAVAGGAYVHILGDTITKAGTPLAWPLKIRGKRWYDVALPSGLRIEAGGWTEIYILTPVFLFLIFTGAITNIVLIVMSMK